MPIAASALLRHELTERQAVRAFVAEMMEYVAGDELQLRHLMHSYDALRVAKRWPKLSSKALSQQLVLLGCARRRADLRHAGGGRPSVIQFPVAGGECVPAARRVA